jgi:hypothetical protein
MRHDGNHSTVSFSHGVAIRVMHPPLLPGTCSAPPSFIRYVTRVFKTGAVTPQKTILCVIHMHVFYCIMILLFQHGGKMPSIWQPFTYLGDHYVDASSRHGYFVKYCY